MSGRNVEYARAGLGRSNVPMFQTFLPLFATRAYLGATGAARTTNE